MIPTLWQSEIMAQAKDRALHVCQTCKSRKKACDKLLPQCSYCTKRELGCSYQTRELGTDPGASDAIHDVGQRLSRLATTDWSGTNANIDDSLDVPTTNVAATTLVHARLRTRMLRWLDATGQPIPTVRDLFVAGVYRWLPVIAPWQLSDAEMNIERTTLSIELLMLTLSMALCALLHEHGLDAASDWRYPGLYLAVKETFASTQATIGPTMTLLQAGLLIAVYEFARRQPQTSYQTMQTCRGLYDILHVGNMRMQDATAAIDAKDALVALQKCSIARGFVILERYGNMPPGTWCITDNV